MIEKQKLIRFIKRWQWWALVPIISLYVMLVLVPIICIGRLLERLGIFMQKVQDGHADWLNGILCWACGIKK